MTLTGESSLSLTNALRLAVILPLEYVIWQNQLVLMGGTELL